jgi:hypothetical protein
MRNSARGLALALQTTNPSLTVMMKDTENHWYQWVPLVEPDTDRLLARSSNLYGPNLSKEVTWLRACWSLVLPSTALDGWTLV